MASRMTSVTAAALALAACGDSGPPDVGEIGNRGIGYAGECLYVVKFVDVTGVDLGQAPQFVRVAAEGLPGRQSCPRLPKGWYQGLSGPRPPPESPEAARYEALLAKGGRVMIQVARQAHR
jgi:hypothetical protein